MPREIMRLVSVTTPAPITTPRIPSSGWAETSAGTAAPTARAISIGEGRTIALEAAIFFRLPLRPDSCNHRESGTQFDGKGNIVRPNLDWDALYHFREIAVALLSGSRENCGPVAGAIAARECQMRGDEFLLHRVHIPSQQKLSEHEVFQRALSYDRTGDLYEAMWRRRLVPAAKPLPT